MTPRQILARRFGVPCLINLRTMPRNPTADDITRGAKPLTLAQREAVWAWQAKEIRRWTDAPVARERRAAAEQEHANGQPIPGPSLDTETSDPSAEPPRLAA